MLFLFKRLPSSMKKLIIPSVGGVLFVVFSSLILFEAMYAKVAVAQNGEKQIVKTHANTVKELLDELGIVVGKHDILSYDLNATIENGMSIDYKQAKRLVVTIDGTEKEYYTVFNSLDRFLAEEKLEFSEHDFVSLEPNTEIVDGLRLTVKKAYEVTIDDGGKEKKVWTTGGSVEQLLTSNEVTLNEHDKVKPALGKDVEKDALITITRVEKHTEQKEESTPFKVEKKEDSSLAKGTEKLISDGKEGTVVKTYAITLENGEEVSREVISEEVKEKSKNKVIAIGTKEPVKQKQVAVASVNNNNSASSDSDGKVMYMSATAFTAYCNGCSGVTATGINLKANPNMKLIAVDPKVIPLGSTVWVEGYGTAIAGDTGGSIKGNRIDAHFPTKADAYAFGRKTVKVKILK